MENLNEQVKNDLSVLRYNKRYRIWRPFMEKYNCQHICEVGVRTGENFRKMIKHAPAVAVAVDCWKDDGIVSHNDVALSQEALDNQYESLKNLLKDNSSVQICREYSSDAVKRFPDNYFDLVYIDADHTFAGALQDIIDWYPKVKKGGFLLGDDFTGNHKTRTGVRFGVVKAVKKFTQDNNLTYFEYPRFKWGIIK